MRVAHRIALAPVFLILFSISIAAETDSRIIKSFPEVQTPQGIRCRETVVTSQMACFNENEEKGILVGSAIVDAAKKATDTRDSGATVEGAGKLGAAQQTNAASVCNAAFGNCVAQCEAAAKELTSYNFEGDYTVEIQNLQNVVSRLCPVFKVRENEHLATAAQLQGASKDGEKVKNAATAGDFLKDNWGKIALGVGGAALIYKATQGKDNKGSAAGSGAAAGGAPDCTKDDASKNLLCDGQLITECSNPLNVASAKCSGFTDRHCGFTAEANKVNSAPGLGSQLCKDAMAGKYCKNETKAKCFSCLNLKDRQTARCTSAPASCAHENSIQEMGYFKYTCPDDPVFLDQKWASVTPIPLPANTPLPSTTNGLSTAVVGQPALSVGQPATLIGQPPAGTGTRTPASDTGPRIGPNVFTRSSQSLQTLCEQGSLNNCGARKSVKN